MKVHSDQELYSFADKKLPFYLRRSFYVHLALLSLTLISGKVISIQQQKLRDKNLELIQSSVRVDMVAMPKYTLNELKNLSSGVEEAKKENPSPTQETKKDETKTEPIQEKVPVEKETTQAFEEVSKKKKADFLSKLKEFGNKKIKSEGNVKAEKGAYGKSSTDLKQLVLSGNKLSKGVSIVGTGSIGEMTAAQIYKAKLPELVRPHWRLPSFLAEKKLKCRVRVQIGANGEIHRAEIYQSSSDSEFDSRAIEAVKSSSFPGFSEELKRLGQNIEVVLGFPL